ncbi:MAG: fumarylacetoacetate hydrolase family protein [Anaerolineae bacterium]|nr:fumarylacetoacetate hydrolase family protein [Anaerolineae bacterium]
MYLTRHYTNLGPRWAFDGQFLPQQFSLELLLELPKNAMLDLLQTVVTSELAEGTLLPPLDPMHEVWACGVTYLRSRQARKAESESSGDVYEKVYDAERPEIFLKAIGWRVAGHQMPIRVRVDSRWSVPEPELALVINQHQEIVGYCVANDVSARDIEGENPLYLPQAKIYNGSCALGPGILLAGADQLRDVAIQAEIFRDGEVVFQGKATSSRMKRSLEELVAFLCQEMDFPHGVFLLTGTGIIPADDFSLRAGDLVRINIASLSLENTVVP